MNMKGIVSVALLFCMMAVVQCLPADRSIRSYLLTKPCRTTYEYMPICGSDGETYPNMSDLNCESQARTARGLPSVKIAHKGSC